MINNTDNFSMSVIQEVKDNFIEIEVDDKCVDDISSNLYENNINHEIN